MPLPMYAALLSPPIHSNFPSTEVAESSSHYRLLTERHIQAMWLEQKYFRSLKTDEGHDVRVISPGIWNSGPGPDFFKAHIIIGDFEVRGDVELHLSDDGWYQHKHHLDNNYRNVVLHISYWPSVDTRPLLTSEGNKIPRTYLKKSLTIPEARILHLIDLDLYPYTHFSGSGTCANSLFRYLSEKEVISFFRSASTWRLMQKYDALAARSGTSRERAMSGLAMVLGHKQNTEAFAELFNLMSFLQLDTEKKCFAFALGQCNFFANKYQLKWNHSTYYQELYALYRTLEISEKIPRLTIKQNKIRPPSHPVRRLAVLSKIACDSSFEHLDNKLLGLWNNSWAGFKNSKNVKQFRQSLNSLLPTYEDRYWHHHYAFEAKPTSKPMALIGEDLKQEMIVNILLPLLYSNIKEKLQELEAFTRLYASFASPKTQKTKYLSHRFFGTTSVCKVLKNTDIQQGAYQLHRDFCIHFEASCQGCPFVMRYKTVFNTSTQSPIIEQSLI